MQIVKKALINNMKPELIWDDKHLANDIYLQPTDKQLIQETHHNTENMLICGDNLDVLKILKDKYTSKIKCIYIDPPYNTGNKFIYNDKRGTSWLTFMYPRLKLAREFLTDDGVIFISIDDNEQAHLKLICDEIFGEENFVAHIFWYKGHGKNNSVHFRNTGEFILCYAKNINKLDSIYTIKDGYEHLCNHIKKAKYKDKDELENIIRKFYKSNKQYKGISMYRFVDVNYIIYRESTLESPTYSIYFYDVIHPVTKLPVKIPKKGWNRTQESMNELIKNNLVVFGKDHTILPRRKSFLNDTKYESPKTLMINKDMGSSEINNLFNINVFDYPKPNSLIKQIISYIKMKPGDIILDFFAGSGTTGEAVMRLNAEDGGNRKFILVQIDEPIDQNKQPQAYNFVKNELGKPPNIFEITRERLIRAGKKIDNNLFKVDTSFNLYRAI